MTVDAGLDRAPLSATWVDDNMRAERSSRIRRFDAVIAPCSMTVLRNVSIDSAVSAVSIR